MVKNPSAKAGDTGSIPGSGRPPGKGNGNPHQYPCLGNPMGRRVWQAIGHGVAKESDTTYQLNNNKLSDKETELLLRMEVPSVKRGQKTSPVQW